MTKISIIQVSYKNFETTTEPCLNSLFACEEFEDLEIILVDNASGKETTSQIKQLISGKNNIKLLTIIFNGKKKFNSRVINEINIRP